MNSLSLTCAGRRFTRAGESTLSILSAPRASVNRLFAWITLFLASSTLTAEVDDCLICEANP